MSFDPKKYIKSRWLKGADLPPGQSTTVTIKAAYEYTFESSGETKPALDFYDLDQSITLNKTQTQAMIDLFGTDPSKWIGKQISMMAVPSSFQGKPTILITAADAAAPQPAQPATPSGHVDAFPSSEPPSQQGDPAAEVQFK